VGQGDWAQTAIFGGLALILITATAVIDRRSNQPLVPASLRGSGTVWAILGWGASINFALTTILFAIPILMHASSEQTGITLLPMTLMIAFNPLITGRIAAVFGALVPIRMGLIALPLGLLLTAFAVIVRTQWTVLAVGLLLCGLGISWSLPALTGFAVNHAPREATGAVGGLLNSARQVGATLAAAITSATLAQHVGSTWFGAALVIAAVLCLFSLCSTARGNISGKGRE
jgi:DHA2 family methylenomycin A resistance protein-like MFS transporter